MKKTLLLLCSMFVLMLSLAIAACGSATPKITFETGGGTQIPPIEAEAGADISGFLPEDPVRDGYFFEGWYLEADFSGEAQDLPTVMPEKSVTYYAKWGEGTGAKLTLTTNDGGVLNKTSFNVKVGENLMAFLEGKEPTPKAGLTFAGWYRGATKLTSADTMPAAGVTVTAKYNASYTVEVYRQQEDEAYVKDATDLTGTAIYGEPFSCDGLVTPDEHFRLGADGRTETDSLGVGETFSIYLAREVFYIFYNANVPEGVQVVTNVMPTGTYVYDGDPTLGECGFVLSGHYRFLGWSRTKSVASKDDLLPAGTTLEGSEMVNPNANFTLYAIWEEGYPDVFSGSDVIYPDSFDNTKVHLEREGIEVKEGTLTGEAFSFDLGSGVTLTGRLLPESKYFFYYRDDYNATYSDMDGTEATLTMSEGGRVVYTDAEKNPHTGTYTINDDGYFVFDADDGGDFLYNLYTLADGTERVVFRRQNLEEQGYYYDAAANIILYLDGLGGLRYYYHTSNAEYTGYDGKPAYIAIGYYELQHHNNESGADIFDNEGDIFVAQTRDISSILKQFTFKNITPTSASVTTEDFPDLPADATIKGTVKLDDGVRGRNYTSKWDQSDNALSLDGYGKGRFGTADGTYTLFTWLWSVEEENGETIARYYLVRFKPNGDDGNITYFRMDLDYGEYVIDRDITPEQAAAFHGTPGQFPIADDLFVLNMTFSNAFIMIYENGQAEVWADSGMTTQHNYVYYLEPALSRSVTYSEDTKLYRFAKDDTSVSSLNQFDFRLEENNEAKIVLPEPHDIATVATNVDGQTLHLDYTARLAYLGNAYSAETAVDYWYTIGYIDLYTFELQDGTRYYYWTQTGQHSNFTAVPANSMYCIEITPELEETSYIGLLFFVDNDPQGVTYLAYQLESGMFRMVAIGNTEKVGDAGGASQEYRFVFSNKLNDMDNSEFDDYRNFVFRLTDELTSADDTNIRTFILKHDDLSYSNFVADGYGTYTYSDGSNNYTGTIQATIGSGDGRLIYFAEDSGANSFIFAVDTSLNRVVEVTDIMSGGDAGYWYWLDNNGIVRENEYLVFDGRGNALRYEFIYLENRTAVQKGTYRRTSDFRSPYTQSDSDTGYFEYFVTIDGETEKYLVTPAQFTEDGIPLFQVQIPHRVGDFTVRGDGSVTSLGYPGDLAIYIDMFGEMYLGNMYIGTVHTGTLDHGFVNDASGKQVHFWALFRVADPNNENSALISVSEDYFFNIDGDELIPLSLPYGDYALYSDGALVSTQVLNLDGISAATVSIGGIVRWSGRYEAISTEEYRFISENGDHNFTFRLSSETIDDETVYIFEEHDEDNDYALFNAEDWTVLVLNGYGDAHYINKYGDVIIGTYTMFDKENKIGAFESDTFSDVFAIGTANTYAFKGYEKAYAAAYYAEDFTSVVVTGSRFIIDGAQYFYTVTDSTVTLYAVSDFAKSTATLPSGSTYTRGSKTYTKYAGGELTFTNSSYALPITLKFTPDGAEFAVAAVFSGNEQGYRVVVSYEKDKSGELKLKTLLTYLASTMDSRVEEYALTLHYAPAEGNTFNVTPHEVGTFNRYASGTATTPIDGDVLTITTGRVGAVNLEPKTGEALTITLGTIEDFGGEDLRYEGSLDDVRTESEENIRLGKVRAITLTGSDGRAYVLRFWLSETVENGDTVRRFIIHSVVVEKTFEIGGIDVTFMQLWESGTHYVGGEQKALVSISAAESLTEMNRFKGALNENTAALVRERFDPSSETNVFEAFVYEFTKDGDGFIETAQKKEGNYKYSEVTTSDRRYTLCFLYTGDASSFNVEYLLTFSDGNSVNATFEKKGTGNVWTITTEDGMTYTATITKLTDTGLTLTRN